MVRAIVWACVSAITTLSSWASACGGGFGQDVTLNPEQIIVLTYRDGVETYIFKPHFCGKATDFGLLLPVPATLTKDPSLGDRDLVAELAAISAPNIQTVDLCKNSGLFSGSSDEGDTSNGEVDHSYNPSDGVDVISTGQVGEFQWQLLKADSAQTFTDWLDANHFPYPASAQVAFDHYVQAGWYFVAFSVQAGTSAPPTGYRLCGDFGPLQLSFPAAEPVIPALIAAAADSSNTFYWRVLSIANHELRVSRGNSGQTIRYAGLLTAQDLSNEPLVAKLANQDEWLTELDLNFTGATLSSDIWLASSPSDMAYRRTEYRYVEVTCGVIGCHMGSTARHPGRGIAACIVAGGIVLLAGTWRRRAAKTNQKAPHNVRP